MVKTRTQTVNRLHALLTQLLPAEAPCQLTADTATQLLAASGDMGASSRRHRLLLVPRRLVVVRPYEDGQEADVQIVRLVG